MKTLVKSVVKMWTPLLLLSLTIRWSEAQNNKIRRPFDNGHGFDVRLAVPGDPGNDYPTLNNIPRTSFSCSGKEPGYYADIEANCQVFRVCTFGSTYGFQSFLCPNGTLFNQAVFVCDWWMNVQCEKSKELYNYKKDVGNLKIGPHFMRDIKKMISHPMRNPYDKTFVKNNLIIMQEYKPPNDQLYNSISENYSQRNSNEVISGLKETSQNSFQNLYNQYNKSLEATTPRIQYYSNYNIYPPINNNVDFFQQQRQRTYSQANIINKSRKLQTDFYNGHTGQTSPTTAKNIFSYTTNLQLLRPNQIYQKTLKNGSYQTSLNPHANIQRDQLVNKKQLSKAEQIKLGAQNSKKQLNQHIAQDKELYSTKSSQIRFSKDTSNKKEMKPKQNLVSNDTTPTLIRKTLAFHKIIKDSKNGSPKSRITFKTWIVRPISGKLLADPTPYTYNTSPKYALENIHPYTLSNTNENSKSSLVEINSSYEPYTYNPPTIPSTQRISTSTTEAPYTFINSFSSSSPTKASLLYLPPTTYKPLPIIYGPPRDNIELSRQYLLPGVINSPLTAAGSSPVPFFQTPFIANSNSFSLNKQSLLNTNHNNLAFSDILTKEKLDITVSDIVRDTNNLLKTESRNEIFDFRQDIQNIDYPEVSYLPLNVDNQSSEQVSLQPPPILANNSRLISSPSIELEPPVESFDYSNKNANSLSYLSYIKKPVLPTIERTVSFKITIPEKIADYIFKKSSKNISDNLEIFDIENTNYFVLANKNSSSEESQYVPIGKIIWNNSSDISPSQDLVFSFLADSINAAKKYSNIATQNIPLPVSTQLRNLNNEKLGPISSKVSQLTSAQYANNKPSGNTNTKNDNTKYKQIQEIRQIIKPTQQSTYKQLSIPPARLQANAEQIYSGQLYQLPVPEVTKQFYNSQVQANAKYKFSNNELANSLQNGRYQNPKENKQKSTKNDIIESRTLSPDSFQPSSNQIIERNDQGSTANTFVDNIYLPKDGITAQIHDNTIGTIPHPLNEDKLIKYKKNQIYYIYTQLNNNNNTSDQQSNNDIINGKFLSEQNRKQSNHVTYQLIPSVGYKLEGTKEKQNLLNTFQIGEFGYPKQIVSHSNQRQDIVADVDYSVNHPVTGNGLYKGPSSYYAPQASIDSLKLKQNTQTNYNANLEKFDINESNGYPKIKPSKEFFF